NTAEAAHTFLLTVPEIGPGSTFSLEHAVEIESDTAAFGTRGKPFAYAASVSRPTLQRWRVEAEGALSAGPEIDFASLGMRRADSAGSLSFYPTKVMTGSGTPYRVYTPFWRALEASSEPPEPCDAPVKIRGYKPDQVSDNLAHWKLLPTRPDWAKDFDTVWQPGEPGAQAKLNSFVGGIVDGYKIRRDFPGTRTTSLLSPHLAFGEISPNRIWHATRGLTSTYPVEDVTHFRKELVWREFSWHLLFHYPELPTENLNRRFDAFPWKNDDALFDAWTRGQTGYPVVDAGMRQLWQHGWMHNRVRMIVASFLIKHLNIDWRRGEQWFRDTLVDADIASNAASWQWVAGSGADAAPFYRIFNPILQGKKFDPDGIYVRRFVPEIAAMPDEFLHCPFEAPKLILKAARIELGSTYPNPVVDHAQGRDSAMAAYNMIKDVA
ncbi:MAG: hypothetical protein RIR97_1947, partial [Pseudomonadota bacterium]